MFELEQALLRLGGTAEDIRDLYNMLGNEPSVDPDRFGNAMLGLDLLIQARFEIAWAEFEKTSQELFQLRKKIKELEAKITWEKSKYEQAKDDLTDVSYDGFGL